MTLFKLLSALFEYPDEEMVRALPELMTLVNAEPDIEPAEREAIAAFMNWLAECDLTEAQARYVKSFDMTPEHALHLTHHLFGDDKNRGPALIDLGEYYKSYGMEIEGNELPDYLPLVLEFASMLEPVEARVFLDPFAKVIAQLGANLSAAESPWAPLVRLIEARARLVPTAFVPEPQPVTETICHDSECESPVTWDAPMQPAIQPITMHAAR
ncbi:MAG: nitrate reductase molybdenum cofactor assembly chaperone [Hydrogenophilaceae bacterium]|nr:nitrate reductase molybdenum cofactor assembly chaperone [Hydrogenophilaceae bacterium]